jgi:hypothetical protein
MLNDQSRFFTDLPNPDFENKGSVVEENLSNPEVAVGTGYSESKWVAERILDTAAERTALRPVVVRLGQVCGDGSGTWNEKEWFPSLVKSALTLGCLPSLDGVRRTLITYLYLADQPLSLSLGLPRQMPPRQCSRCLVSLQHLAHTPFT